MRSCGVGSVSHNNLTGLGRPKDFLCHKLGHEISGMFDVAHGATLSAVWGSWARYVYRIDVSRFARYGRRVWGIEEEEDEAAAVKAIEKTEDFFRSLHMPVCIGELEIGVQRTRSFGNWRTVRQRGIRFSLGPSRK